MTGSSLPNASPCTVLAAMRSPVNEPGPRPNAIASSSRSDQPQRASSWATIGSINAWCSRGRTRFDSSTKLPSPIATEHSVPEVSMASMRGMDYTIIPGR